MFSLFFLTWLTKEPKAVFCAKELFDFKFRTNDENRAFDAPKEVVISSEVLCLIVQRMQQDLGCPRL
jgi:hypothetical protein